MAQVRLQIGGRSYELACRAGEEPHYEALAARIDAKTEMVRSAIGSASEARQLLLAALLLADDLDTTGGAVPPPVDPALIARLEGFAQRLEALGAKLENGATSA